MQVCRYMQVCKFASMKYMKYMEYMKYMIYMKYMKYREYMEIELSCVDLYYFFFLSQLCMSVLVRYLLNYWMQDCPLIYFGLVQLLQDKDWNYCAILT